LFADANIVNMKEIEPKPSKIVPTLKIQESAIVLMEPIVLMPHHSKKIGKTLMDFINNRKTSRNRDTKAYHVHTCLNLCTRDDASHGCTLWYPLLSFFSSTCINKA
jgi:hypothetical protein